jgi:hypothetical protein
MVKHRVGWILSLALAGCSGSSSTAPTLGPLERVTPQFSIGRYMLQMTAPDFSSDPLIPACAGSIGVPRAGKSVTVELTVIKDGVEWVGRAAGAQADIELRFRDAGELPFGRRALVGTIRGQATDMGIPGLFDPRDVSVAVAGNVQNGAALLDGQTAFLYSVSTLVGRAAGDFRFRDSAGNVGACPAVSININAPN